MSHPNIKCIVCGGNNFTADAGSFFCLECNTQSQDIREEVFDEYFGAQKGTTRVLQKKPTSKTILSDQTKKLTSWEVLNYVLKGITDELINLGAKPGLKIVVLQLWASYLRKLELAFTSVEIQCKPKLGYMFKRSDAQIVYGITDKQLKEKNWRRSRSKTSSAVSSVSNTTVASGSSWEESNLSRRSILRKLTIRKKALASAEYTKLSQEKAPSFSQTLDELDSSSDNTETPKRIKITKHAKSLLISPSGTSTTDNSPNVRRRLARNEMESVRNVTTAKLVAIINIALALTQEDVQVSDFIRLVGEGYFSLGNLRKYLPEGCKVDSFTQRMIEVNHLSYVKCQKMMTVMCKELEVEELPAPNLYHLAERFCLELQLPDDFVQIVKRLLLLSTSTNSSKSKTGCHCSHSSEVQAMSAVVIVMKLLFSLDDSTEFELSRTAAEINKVSREEGQGKQLFVFSEWMQYIECRKAVLAFYHLPTRTAVYGDSVEHDPELFLQHLEQTSTNKQADRELQRRYALKKDWVEAVSRCLRKLVDDQQENSYITFPASLTPFHSGAQLLLTKHADLVAPVRSILDKNFTKHSMDHVLTPDRCADFCLTNDLNIVQQDGAAALFQIEQISLRKDSTVIPRQRINQVNISVDIVKSLRRTRKEKKTNLNSSGEEIPNVNFLEDFVSDDSDEDVNGKASELSAMPHAMGAATCHTSLPLFKPYSQYWFCHTNLGKNSCSQDEFEMFAMKIFPSSFLWFLKECSRTIHVPTKELYTNIISVESKQKNILNEAQFLLRSRKRKRN